MHLLKWLQDRLADSPGKAGQKQASGAVGLNDGSGLAESIEKFALKTTHALELSKRSLCDVPEEVFKMAAECDASTIDLSKNAFDSVPKGWVHTAGFSIGKVSRLCTLTRNSGRYETRHELFAFGPLLKPKCHLYVFLLCDSHH